MPMHAGPARRAAGAAVAAGVALAGYLTLVRPKILRWGATDQEATERLPGDEVVEQPRYQTTHPFTDNLPTADPQPTSSVTTRRDRKEHPGAAGGASQRPDRLAAARRPGRQ